MCCAVKPSQLMSVLSDEKCELGVVMCETGSVALNRTLRDGASQQSAGDREGFVKHGNREAMRGGDNMSVHLLTPERVGCEVSGSGSLANTWRG